MARNILVLWRWSEAVASENYVDFSSVGSQMKVVKKGDRLFICATTEGELYVLGLLEAKKVVREHDRGLRESFGRYRALCRNVGGPFQIIPLGRRKWQLRFVNTDSDRLDPNVKLAMQVRQHRFLSDESADILASLLGEEVATIERERRFLEGERRAANTVRAVRSAALRADAKNRWGTRCYCCGFDFEEFYGDLGQGFAVIHHLDPLGGLNGRPRETSVDDVRIVCANCHYILHRQDPPLHVDDLKRRIGRRWVRWSSGGVRSHSS